MNVDTNKVGLGHKIQSTLFLKSFIVSTRSSDSLVLSIPYVRSSLGKRAFSVIGPRLWNSLPPDTRNSNSLPIFRSKAQNTPLQNCIPSLGSFPSPWTVYPDFDSCYSHFMPYRMTPSVRHRAIEVHYYYRPPLRSNGGRLCVCYGLFIFLFFFFISPFVLRKLPDRFSPNFQELCILV